MTDGEGTPPGTHGAPQNSYHMALPHDSFPSGLLGNGSGIGNDGNRPQLTPQGSSGSNGKMERLYQPPLPPPPPPRRHHPSYLGGDADAVIHLPSSTSTYSASANTLYSKAFPMGSQMPVSWMVNSGYHPSVVAAPLYASTPSSPSLSVATTTVGMANKSIDTKNGNKNKGKHEPKNKNYNTSGSTNAKNISPPRNGQSPSSGRNAEVGHPNELHEDRSYDNLGKQLTGTLLKRQHAQPQPQSQTSNANTANMAMLVNTQEKEFSSHNRNNCIRITSTTAPNAASANNQSFQFQKPTAPMPNSMPVYHQQHHPLYLNTQELNRPYYQEYQATPSNHHHPQNVPLDHMQPLQQQQQQQQQQHQRLHQMSNPPLIHGFASPPASLENPTKSPVASDSVIMQALPPQAQLHMNSQQQLAFQDGQQQYVRQQFTSPPLQLHPYQANHLINSNTRKIVKSPATQISNIINHDGPVMSPIHSKRNSRSSISSLLSDQVPEKSESQGLKAVDKTPVAADDLQNIGEGAKLANESVKEPNVVIPEAEPIASTEKAEREPNLEEVKVIKTTDPIILPIPSEKVDTISNENQTSKVNQSIPSPATKRSATNGKSENKLTLKIPAKRGRKPKAFKIHLSTPESKDKIKVKNGQSVSKTLPASKFVTLKVNGSKLKSLLDKEKETPLIDLTPSSSESTSLALVENGENPDSSALTTNSETIQMTHQQLVQIHQNNKQLISQLDDVKNTLPDLFQLSTSGLPHIPKGYIPLVMAPNGLLIPMDYINVKPNEKSVSIMHPLWEAAVVGADANVVNTEDVSKTVVQNAPEKKQLEDVNGKSKSRRKNFGFDRADKLASLQLYLFSKEAKINMRKVDKVTGLKRFKKQISYYNRLLEREQLEFIETYRQERNKCQKMLNDLESGEDMTDFEKDLLERKDYELLREEIAKNYNDENNYLDYLNHVIELQSIQCLDYATRLVKLKNYLNMESVRLERHKNRLCRINTNKSHSIWKRYVKTGGNRSRRLNVDSSSSCGNSPNWNTTLNLISQNDFMLLTNPNSRAYGTYVLNNSMDKGNENQNEIVELLDYFLPEKSTLRELYKEMKRLDNDNTDKNSKHTSVNSVQKNDMISKYGLKESNSSTGNRLLKELQIDGMNVDIRKNDRIERRGYGQRKARNNVSSSNGGSNLRNGSYGARNGYNGTGNGNADTSGAEADHLAGSVDGGYTSSTDAMRITAGGEENDLREHNGSRSDDLDSGDVERALVSGNGGSTSVVGDVSNIASSSSITGSGTGSRNELNITSCLDPTLCDIDRVKMLNLNSEEIGMSFTKVYGMPKGLRPEEVDSDLAFLRSVLR